MKGTLTLLITLYTLLAFVVIPKLIERNDLLFCLYLGIMYVLIAIVLIRMYENYREEEGK